MSYGRKSDMVNGRQDGWSHSEDCFLADTILTYIKSGSTQLKAFEEVGRKLSRTAAACGFRWNSCVRRHYQEEIHQAKLARQKIDNKIVEHKIDNAPDVPKKKPETIASQVDFETCLKFLQKLGRKLQEHSFEEYDGIAVENNQLRNTILSIAKERDSLEKQLTEIKADYQTLLSYFEKARRLAISDTLEEAKTRFQMDQNGNLERV